MNYQIRLKQVVYWEGIGKKQKSSPAVAFAAAGLLYVWVSQIQSPLLGLAVSR